ncbi:MAG: glyoxylate/hydroxypyruvate reductase A [Alphaproteobacteria bacterium]|nr:glyoxylate/hydroxypyruvate reductase A [Alphaproteobacteria bacterium]
MPTLLLISSQQPWPVELNRHMPELTVRRFPDIGDPASIDYALVWMPDPGLLKTLPNLKAIFSIAAGVDHILRDPDLPKGIPIVRMSDPYQAAMMSEYAIMAVRWFHRGMHDLRRAQQEARWTEPPVAYTPDFAVGVLGLGDIGREIAARLRTFGFQVHGWTRTPRRIEDIVCHHGPDGLMAMLPKCRYVVNVLPATATTRGLLDARRFAAMPRGAFLVNLGRGMHVVDDDLLAALDRRHLAGAFLDVFVQEPLPGTHPYWRHPNVTVTPHMAGELLPRTAAKSVAAAIKQHMAGEALGHVFESSRGY